LEKLQWENKREIRSPAQVM